MVKLINPKLLLIPAIAVIIFFRFYKLPSYPASLSIDEVSFGYNARAILRTGTDEYGEFMPIVFKALGDYKLPIPIYLTALTTWIFGYNEFAIRLPAAFAGTLTIAVIYYLLLELKYKKISAAFGCIWFSIIPWHFVYSRASYEAVEALLFLLLGLLLFIKSANESKGRLLILSAFFFSLSLWTYNSMRVFVPVLVFYLLVAYKRIFKIGKLHLLSAFVTFSILGLSVYFLSILNPNVMGRAKDLWLTQDSVIFDRLHHTGYKNSLEAVFDNNTFIILQNLAKQYLQYFDLKFLFWKGLEITPQDRIGIGVLYLVDIFIVGLGIFLLAKSKESFKKGITFFWLFAGPIAAAFTRGENSSIRTLVWSVAFLFIVTQAFEYLIENRKILFISYLAGLFVNAIFFADLYTVAFQKYNSDIWHYGYKEMLTTMVCGHESEYKKIIVTDKYGIIEPKVKTVPQLYYLIHCNIDPKVHLETGGIPKIEFRQPQWFYDAKEENTLLIGSRWDFPEKFPEKWIDATVRFPSGEVALYAVKTAPEKTRSIPN